MEGLAVLGEHERAAELYPLTLEPAARSTLVSAGLLSLAPAAIAAAAGQHWEVAEQHFEEAVHQADEMPHKLEQARIRYWHASMLVDRNGPGDCDKARQLVGHAITGFRQIGMPIYLTRAEELAARLPRESPL